MARHGENIRKRADGRWEGRYPVYSGEKARIIYRSVYGRTYQDVKSRLVAEKNNSKQGNNLKRGDSQKQEDGQKQGDCPKQGDSQKQGDCPKQGDSQKQGDFPKQSDSQKQVNSLKQVTEGYIAEETGKANRLPKEILFNEIAEEWLSSVKITKKQSTYVKYTLIYRNYLEKSFHGMNLHKIKNFSMESLSDALPGGIRKSVACVLSQILKFASKKYSISSLNLNISIPAESRKPVEILTRQEQSGLLQVLYHKMDNYKMAVILCLHTGLRLGEICALKWSDVDFENSLIRVNSTVQRLYVEGGKTKTALVETMPKSEFSRREIPLPAVMVEFLLSFRDTGEYVFGGCKPVEPRTMQNHFKKLIREAKLPDKNFHILRHTFATNCIEGGTDVKSLSEILGHSDVRITLNRYVHPSMETKRKHLNTLSVFYGQICGQTN